MKKKDRSQISTWDFKHALAALHDSKNFFPVRFCEHSGIKVEPRPIIFLLWKISQQNFLFPLRFCKQGLFINIKVQPRPWRADNLFWFSLCRQLSALCPQRPSLPSPRHRWCLLLEFSPLGMIRWGFPNMTCKYCLKNFCLFVRLFNLSQATIGQNQDEEGDDDFK